jgi:hypothetical protein
MITCLGLSHPWRYCTRCCAVAHARQGRVGDVDSNELKLKFDENLLKGVLNKAHQLGI